MTPTASSSEARAPALVHRAETTPGAVAARPWAIRVEGIGKQYHLGAVQAVNDNLREDIMNGLARLVGRRKTEEDDRSIWALRNIDLEVARGETLGIIGRNGAGKSTLLKLLSRITPPTEGTMRFRGRLQSLLEVGTGFHRELTGLENIYLNGAIMGMRRDEINQQFHAIVEFSGVERFLDTPVKFYSSGMYVRLAFAVAAHLRADILIVDEVLAVGDASFQKKCLGKMKSVSEEGRTVIFVSHNMAAVQSLCNRVVLLEAGRIELDGPADSVVRHYALGAMDSAGERVWNAPEEGPGDDTARLQAVRFTDSEGKPISNVDLTEPIYVEIQYRVQKAGACLNVSVSLFNQDDIYVFSSPSTTDRDWFHKPHPVGLYRSRCMIPGHSLNDGRYSLNALLVEKGPRIITEVGRVVSIDVTDPGTTRGDYFGPWLGVVRPNLEWGTAPVDTPDSNVAALGPRP